MKCGKGQNCEAMQMALDAGSIEAPIGISLSKGTTYSPRGIRVKKDGKKVLLYLNTCPWCQALLQTQAPKKRAKS